MLEKEEGVFLSISFLQSPLLASKGLFMLYEASQGTVMRRKCLPPSQDWRLFSSQMLCSFLWSSIGFLLSLRDLQGALKTEDVPFSVVEESLRAPWKLCSMNVSTVMCKDRNVDVPEEGQGLHSFLFKSHSFWGKLKEETPFPPLSSGGFPLACVWH